jgi:lysophospholipase L1-like esterase
MQRRRLIMRLTAALAVGLGVALVARTQEPPKAAPPTARPSVPAPQDRPRFHELHESFLARGKAGPVRLLFLGDSITYGWTKWAGLWEREFGKYQPANFGIGSDRTQNLLWRIENGEVDGIAPKVVVLMIGTNNSGSDSADAIFEATKQIVQRLQARLPAAKILLLAIFPRGPRHLDAQRLPRDDGVTRMRVIQEVNRLLPRLDDGRNVRVLNINHVFFGPDGKLSEKLMYDQLHLTEDGYRAWAEAMRPLLDDMMK